MTRFNISQATYDRMMGRLAKHQSQTLIDVRDLMAAYENAVELLDEVADNGSLPHPLVAEVEEFLFLESGEPRVHLEGV